MYLITNVNKKRILTSMMEEQLEENPDVLLKKINDLQKENAGLHQKIVKLEKETKVLQEFVLPSDEKYGFFQAI